MNERDLIKKREDYLLSVGGPHSIPELSNIPFTSFDEIVALEKQKKLGITTPYNIKIINFLGTKSEIFMHYFWSAMPFVTFLIYLVLSLLIKRSILLIALPLCIIGFLSSSPYGNWRKYSSGISLVLFFGLLFISKPWAFIVFAYLISLIFTWTTREQYNIVVKERVLSSEIIFTQMFYEGIIGILDFERKQYFGK